MKMQKANDQTLPVNPKLRGKLSVLWIIALKMKLILEITPIL